MSFASRFRLSHAWAVLLLAVLALACLALPRLAEQLIFRHDKITSGQLWRLWTGHLVHFGWRHLVADLAVFLAAGLWLESFAPRTTRAFLALAPAAISVSLYYADPTLAIYGGLSGLAIGLLVLLALVQIRRDRTAPRGLWVVVLVIVAVKIALEAFNDTPLLASLGPGIKVSSLAHLGGVACALLAWPLARREAAAPAAAN